MPIKNYTTQVSALKSIGEIQANLVAHGAKAIMIDFNGSHEPVSLSFLIATPQGEIPFRLPANVEKLKVLLIKQLSSSAYRQWDTSYQNTKKQKAYEQANRVAWRIIKDWVDAQLAIVETDMVTIQEIFLPYWVVKDNKTLYQRMEEQRFLLTQGNGDATNG